MTWQAPEVDLARANVYRYLALATLPSDDARFARLLDPGFGSLVRRAVEWVRTDPLFAPSQTGPDELWPGELEAHDLFALGGGIEQAHVELFGLSISKTCPPYGGEYYPNRDITYRSQRLADVAGFYRAFGLERAGSARERLDHLSFEAEFMQILVVRQLYAQRNRLPAEAVEICRDAQRRFFVDHLGWWLPAFGVQLEARAESFPFYASLGRLARGWAAAERAVLGVAPFTELPVATVDAYEPEGAGFTCGPVSGDATEGPAELVSLGRSPSVAE